MATAQSRFEGCTSAYCIAHDTVDVKKEQRSNRQRNKILPAKTINVGSDIVEVMLLFCYTNT
jgi:hypothetical protein